VREKLWFENSLSQ